MASKRVACPGSYFGLLISLCPLENTGAIVSLGRPWR